MVWRHPNAVYRNARLHALGRESAVVDKLNAVVNVVGALYAIQPFPASISEDEGIAGQAVLVGLWASEPRLVPAVGVHPVHFHATVVPCAVFFLAQVGVADQAPAGQDEAFLAGVNQTPRIDGRLAACSDVAERLAAGLPAGHDVGILGAPRSHDAISGHLALLAVHRDVDAAHDARDALERGGAGAEAQPQLAVGD